MVHVSYEVRRSGNIQEMVTLKTNDPYRPIVYLTLRGTVPQDLQVNPTLLTFATDKGKVSQKNVTILAPPTMDVTETTSDNPGLKVTLTLDAADDAGKSWKVQVALGDKAPVGEWKSTLTIKTTHAERPTITIPINGFIRGDLQISPPSGFFGLVKIGAKATQTIALKSRTSTPFRVLKIECTDPKVIISKPQQRNGGGYDLALTLATRAAAFIDATLNIQTDVPGEETLTVPVTALVE